MSSSMKSKEKEIIDRSLPSTLPMSRAYSGKSIEQGTVKRFQTNFSSDKLFIFNFSENSNNAQFQFCNISEDDNYIADVGDLFNNSGAENQNMQDGGYGSGFQLGIGQGELNNSNNSN